jgi:peptide-methionine (S)-S-oxide reductase
MGLLLIRDWSSWLPQPLRLAMRRPVGVAACSTLLVALGSLGACTSSEKAIANFPDPAVDASLAAGRELEAAVFAGGCFWGIEAVYQHVKGVQRVVSGYSGGTAASATYAMISSGHTQHAESVHIIYDRAQVSYGQLLKIFFAIAHDPTQLNRQGPDRGSQYRSAIFYTTKDQQRVADAYIEQLNRAQVFDAPIVTSLSPLMAFYEAEDYHQNYASRHPDELYILLHDAPKVATLQKRLPGLYVERMARDGATPD